MPRIQVAKVPREPEREDSPLTLLARLCYFYPQYTLSAARRLPYKRVMLLLKVARQEKAIEYWNLVQIESAPYTNKRKGLTELSSEYKKMGTN